MYFLFCDHFLFFLSSHVIFQKESIDRWLRVTSNPTPQVSFFQFILIAYSRLAAMKLMPNWPHLVYQHF